MANPNDIPLFPIALRFYCIWHFSACTVFIVYLAFVHSDAPALSTDNDAMAAASSTVTNAPTDAVATDSNDAGEQWDDEALAATLTQKKAVATSAELLDMKALDLKRSEQGDIQEKLRVEQNKAKLAAAREGMEKEAQRLKEEKEKKAQEAAAAVKPRFGAAAAAAAGRGDIWVPPHLRGGAAAPLNNRGGLGGLRSGTQKLDTEDENLFPDLAAADAILEKQKQQPVAYKIPKKTPVGGGATWGSRPKLNLKKPEEKAPEPVSEPEPAVQATEKPKEVEEVATKAAEPVPVAESAPEPAKAAAVAPIKPKKKKKKDLSTFKAAS